MENLLIYCNPPVLLFPFLFPKAKKLDSETESKMRFGQREKGSFGGWV